MDIDDIRYRIDSGIMTSNVEETIIANDIMKEFFEGFEQEKLGEMVSRSKSVGSHVAMGILDAEEIDTNVSNVEDPVLGVIETERQCEGVAEQGTRISNGDESESIAEGSIVTEYTVVVQNDPAEAAPGEKQLDVAGKDRPLFSRSESKLVWSPRRGGVRQPRAAAPFTVEPGADGGAEREYRCALCPYRTARAPHAASHARAHDADRFYNCNVCHFKTTDKKNIRHHARIHSGEKPYACEICGKAFSQDSTLKRHMKVHSVKREYSCDICKKKFTEKEDLKRHKEEHKTKKLYLCDICNKSMNLKTEFVRHVRYHSAKPYRCGECDRCFGAEAALRRHRLVHTGEKPYHCDDCDKGFSLKANYRRHLKTH